MSARELDRREAFKKGIDSSANRRNRDETRIQIRKSKKEEQLLKRRGMDKTNNNNANIAEQPPIKTPADLPALVAVLQNITPENIPRILESVRGIRRMLSVEKNPPVVQVIESGAIPYLKKLLTFTPCNEIQFEAAWALTNVASTQFTGEVVNAGAVPDLVLCLRSADAHVREQAAWCLGNIAGDSPEFRDYILQAGSIEPLLMNVVKPDNPSLLGNVVWTISNLMRGKPQPDLTAVVSVIPALAHLLEKPHNNDILTDVCWALSYLSDGDNMRIQAVMEHGVTPRLVKLLDHSATSVLTPVVRCLGNFVSGDDHQTQAVIDAGAVKYGARLLQHQKKNIRKEVCWLLSNVAAGTHPQVRTLFTRAAGLQQVVNLAISGEWEVRKEAIWVIANICTGGTDRNIECVVEIGGIDALCSVLEVSDPKIVMVALEAIERILACGERGGKGYDTLIHECDGLEKIEQLQDQANEDIYQKVYKIIDVYFGAEDDEDENLAPAVSGNTFEFGIQSPSIPSKLFADQSPSKTTGMTYNFA